MQEVATIGHADLVIFYFMDIVVCKMNYLFYFQFTLKMLASLEWEQRALHSYDCRLSIWLRQCQSGEINELLISCIVERFATNILTVGKIISGFRLSYGFHKQKNDKFYLSRSGDSIKILKMVCTIWHIWQYSDRPLCISFLVANSQ